MNEAKQKYYDYEPAEGGDWWVKEKPFLEPWVQKRLDEIGGLSEGVRPRLRIVWGGDEPHDMTEEPTLKYKVVRNICTGYYYKKADGTDGRTTSMNLPTDAAVPWQFHPIEKRIELGRLRWIIEQHIPAHELKASGRFEHRRGTDGKVILRELPPNGIYQAFFVIQTRAHQYRDPDPEVITAVEAMWHYNINMTEAQWALDMMEMEKKNVLTGAKEASKIWTETLKETL